jgi:hypothetical protein
MTAPAPTNDLTWALATIAANGQRAARPRAYYDGDHPLAFATAKFREAFGSQFAAFADNLMPVIADTLADRLQVDGFTTGTDVADERAREIWRRNRMAKRAGEVHQDAIIEGDSVLIVWPDAAEPNVPVFYPNAIGACAIRYDDEQPGFITRAAKAWQREDRHSRVNVYYPDRIEKYVSIKPSEGGLESKAASYERLAEENGAWPLPNPYGKVPVFHFCNRGGIGQMGKSEMHEAMPVQDTLNKTVCDRVVAQEFYAFRQRWATGLDPGEDDQMKTRPGGVWAVENGDVKFGEFSASDIEQYVTVAESDRKEIARVSRTPLHYFTLEGDFPSGEAQKTADGPLLAKTRDRQVSWGMVWADAMRFALQIAGAGDHDCETIWADTQPRNETEQLANAVVKVGLGVSERQVLAEVGYTPEQIDTMREQKATEDIIPTVAQ